MSKENFNIGNVKVGLNTPLFVMAGPCVIESEKNCIDIAKMLVSISQRTNVGIVFKASFDKANRSSISSFRGPGLEDGLKILDSVRSQTKLPVMTDVHEPAQAAAVGKVVDCLQIPAFLCRQTDLLCACAQTGKPINVKKGQFLSPDEMKNVVEKIRACGNNKIMLTERGSFFGYQDLVVDFRGLIQMQSLNCPVVFDATHSLQKPNQKKGVSGGNPEYIIPMARAAVAAGVQGLFIETHPDPGKALSDGENMLPLNQMDNLLAQILRVKDALS